MLINYITSLVTIWIHWVLVRKRFFCRVIVINSRSPFEDCSERTYWWLSIGSRGPVSSIGQGMLWALVGSSSRGHYRDILLFELEPNATRWSVGVRHKSLTSPSCTQLPKLIGWPQSLLCASGQVQSPRDRRLLIQWRTFVSITGLSTSLYSYTCINKTTYL